MSPEGHKVTSSLVSLTKAGSPRLTMTTLT